MNRSETKSWKWKRDNWIIECFYLGCK